MINKVSLERFLSEAEKISSLRPSYRSGGSGTDGTCDCIGLVIGTVRRAGGVWPGLHGSNYAARSETEGLARIDGARSLRIGELVYKAREPGEAGYALPDKYRKGGKIYTGDLRDYYHVGIVESVSPLRIRHMSTPGILTDTSLGKWKYHGWCGRVEESRKAGEEKTRENTHVNSQDHMLRLMAEIEQLLDQMYEILGGRG